MTRMRFNIGGNAFQKVFRFSSTHWRRQPFGLAFVVGAITIATLIDVVTPLFAGRLVDAIARGADPGTRQEAANAFFALLGLGAVTVMARLAAFKSMVGVTLRMMTDIAQQAFHRVQRFSTDWHANSFAGSTVRKVTRGMWALDLLNDTLFTSLFPSGVMLLGATLLLGWFWPSMGLTVAVGSIVYIGLTVALSLGYVAPAARLANTWDSRVSGALADAITCNGVVKAFAAEEREEGRLARVLDKWRARTNRSWSRMVANGISQDVALLVLMAAVLGVALMLWQQGAAGAGDITFVLTMFLVLQGYLRDVGQHIRNLQRSVNDMEELADIINHPIGVTDREGAKPLRVGKGAIRFDNVTFRYGGHTTPLYKNFSVEIAGGERVGLVGHSGSGKTTFVKLIQRLYDVTGGAILVDGQNIAEVTQDSLRAQIAIVQQEPVLFHRTLAENIAYARPGATRCQVVEAARLANASAFIEDLPKGYETLVGERGVKLSGGERQRVALARAFLADAPVLILDEATSSLDSTSELLIQEAMERLMEGRTTLVIAHRLSTVKSLDRLLVFDRGRIAEEGDHRSLIQREGGIYRELFERQALELTRGLTAA